MNMLTITLYAIVITITYIWNYIMIIQIYKLLCGLIYYISYIKTELITF